MRLEITRPGPVLPVRVDPSGADGPTRAQSRGRRWRRSSRGLFVPADVDPDAAVQRIVEAAAAAPDGSAVTGWGSLYWRGAAWFGGVGSSGELLPVPLAVGDRRHAPLRTEVELCYDWLFEDDITEIDGLPVTRPERAVCTATLRQRGIEASVQTIDMALASRLVTASGLAAYADRLRGRPHSRRLLSAVALARDNVWSPMETTMRLRWIGRRPAAPLLCNAPLFDHSGAHLLTPDLLDPVAGVAGEYDGRVHDESRVRRRDLEREEKARSVGLEVVSMVSTDLVDLASFERRLDAAYARAARRSHSGRWTLSVPSWWSPSSHAPPVLVENPPS